MQFNVSMLAYRDFANEGFQTVQQLASEPDQDAKKIETAIHEYRLLFRIIDAMTLVEQEQPLEIGFGRLSAIAKAASASEKDVLMLLVSFHDFANNLAILTQGQKPR
jgi:signal recognition particle GTPase